MDRNTRAFRRTNWLIGQMDRLAQRFPVASIIIAALALWTTLHTFWSTAGFGLLGF